MTSTRKPLTHPPVQPNSGSYCTTELARWLSSHLNAPVVDKTGITGEHDLRVTYDSVFGNDVPSIFTLLEEQFELKVESQKVSLKMLVIDSVERPTEN